MADSVAVSLPADKYSADLFNDLGVFWTRLYSDAGFIRDYCLGSSLVAAQVYLDFVETVALTGVVTVPSFHRERWLPAVIRRSERNTGRAVSLYLGAPEVNIGPQEHNEYRAGQTFDIGGNLVKDGYVVYPLHGAVPDTGVYKICSRVMDPQTVLTRNIDYYVSDGCAVFRLQHDPFSADNLAKWQTRSLQGGDLELLMWGADALFDRGFIQDTFGSVLNYRKPAGAYYEKSAKALWNLKLAGCSVAAFGKAVNTALDLPVSEGYQVVTEVRPQADGSTVVATDTGAAAHVVLPNQELLPWVVPGYRLSDGEPLTASVKVYHARDGRNTIASLAADMPGIFLSSGIIFAPGMSSGVTVGGARSPIWYAGRHVPSGRHLFKFELGGAQSEQDIYWSYVWSSAGDHEVAMETALDGYITNRLYRTFTDADYSGGGDVQACTSAPVVGYINPFEFVTANVTRDNLTVVVVDLGALPEYITTLEPVVLMKRMMPAHAYTMFVVSVELPADSYDLATAGEGAVVAAAKLQAETARWSQDPGYAGPDDELSYTDSHTIRWVKTCR